MADTNIDDQLIVKIEKELDALERKVRRELAIHTGFNRDLYGSQKTGHEVWDFWKTQNLQKMLDLAYSYTCDHVAIDGPLAQALQRARKQATPRAADGSEDEHVASVASENHAVRRKGSVDDVLPCKRNKSALMSNHVVHIVIVCVKDHEKRAFLKLLHEKCGSSSATTTIRTGNAQDGEARYEQTDFVIKYEQTAFDSVGQREFIVSAVSFTGGAQGPVETALRVGQVMQNMKQGKPNEYPLYFGMVGICGGRELLKTWIATSARAPENARVKEFDAAKPPQRFIEKIPGEGSQAAGSGIEYYRIPNTKAEVAAMNDVPLRDHIEDFARQKQTNVAMTVFLSYNAVREDCGFILQQLQQSEDCEALDMEAYAFFKAANIYNVKLLPVIKGVSDVSRCDADTQHNKDVLAKQQLDPSNHQQLRLALRSKAAENAAITMLELIDFLHKNL